MHTGKTVHTQRPGEVAGESAPKRGIKRWLAALLAATVVLLGFTVPTAAYAEKLETEHFTWEVAYGGDPYNGTPVADPNRDNTAPLGYDLQGVEPGSSVTITLPEGVELPTTVPGGNENVASIEQNGTELTVTFTDEFNGNLQGYIDFKFRFGAATGGSAMDIIPWKLEGVSSSETVIIKHPDDQFRPPVGQTLTKGVGENQLAGAFGYDLASDTVTVPANLAERYIAYSLTVQTTAAQTSTISDTIASYLAYDEGSFSASLVTWDENGLNRQESDLALPAGQPTFDGKTFTIEGFELPANANIAINYRAQVDDDALEGDEGLLAALQAEAAKIDSASGGDFGLDAANTATLDGGNAQTANARISGHRDAEPQPGGGPNGVGNFFGKTTDFPNTIVNPEGQPEGEFDDEFPITIPYTLTANLSEFDDTENAWDAKWDLPLTSCCAISCPRAWSGT